MKKGSLFCFVVMRSTKLGSFRSFFDVFGKLSMRRGAWAWFDDILNYGAKVLEY
jgi:hypothetical protein